MEITSPTGKCYVIGSELGSTKLLKFYQCTAGDNKACILKIARKAVFNGLLDREAFLLQTLEKEAFDLETAYQKKNDGERKLNYHFLMCYWYLDYKHQKFFDLVSPMLQFLKK